jgi:hypothetical protein
MKGKPLSVPIAKLRRHSVRTHQRSEDELRALARSWLKLPVHPIVIGRRDSDLID